MFSINYKIKFMSAGLFLLALTTSFPSLAKEIFVQGIVTDENGEPLEQVNVYDKSKQEAGSIKTGHDGFYEIKIDENGTLLFTHMSCDDMEREVNGESTINITMHPSSHALQEVTVQAKGIRKRKFAFERGSSEQVGNTFFYRQQIRVPLWNLRSNVRVVCQPYFRNLTRGTVQCAKPAVIQGREYGITQERMYDFDLTKDSLTGYIVKDYRIEGGDAVFSHTDSVRVDNPNDKCIWLLEVQMEDYKEVFNHAIAITVTGKINPLYFLEYKVIGSMVEDSTYFPQPKRQSLASEGVVNLSFQTGRSNLDLGYADNQSEMDKLIAQLRSIENDPNAILKGITITGTASPEGTYELNKRLAQSRMESVKSILFNQLDTRRRKSIDFQTHAEVESWMSVVGMLRADSLVDYANEIEEIINSVSNPTQQSRRIVALPFYRSTIVPDYLPRLRRVNYEIRYQQNRVLTEDELWERYRTNTNMNTLTDYDYWRLYRKSTNLDEQEKICRMALNVIPSNIVFNTDLASILISKEKPDAKLLERFLDDPKRRKIPNETRLNQAVAWLSMMQYDKADSIAQLLPDNEACHKIKMYAAALSGGLDRDNVADEVSKESLVNAVVVALALHDDEKAYERAQELAKTPDAPAKEHYVRAVAANRLGELKYNEATYHLKQAFIKDPMLKYWAETDEDVLNILKDVLELIELTSF